MTGGDSGGNGTMVNFANSVVSSSSSSSSSSSVTASRRCRSAERSISWIQVPYGALLLSLSSPPLMSLSSKPPGTSGGDGGVTPPRFRETVALRLMLSVRSTSTESSALLATEVAKSCFLALSTFLLFFLSSTGGLRGVTLLRAPPSFFRGGIGAGTT